MKRTLILFALFAVAACGGPKTSDEILKTSFQEFDATYHCIDWKGTQRCYYLIPPKGQKPKHLLVALHPAFTSVQLTEDVSHLAANVVPSGYVLVYPEGIDKQWNDGRVMTKVKTYNDKTDDVGFINSVTARIQKEYHFGPGQTTLAGMSNGGMMTLRMACESEAYGSYATIVANLPLHLREQCHARPKPMLMVWGTHDTIVHYNGGALAKDGKSQTWGMVESAKNTEKFFAARNGCQLDNPRQSVIADPNVDATRAVVSMYQGCRQPFAAINVEGMGHTWPGEESRIKAFLTQRGPVTHQFDAAKTIEQFVDLVRTGKTPKGANVMKSKTVTDREDKATNR